MDGKKKIAILLFIIITSFLNFSGRYDALIKDFYNTAVTKENLFKDHVSVSTNFIKSIKVFGSIYFEGGENKVSEFYSLLQYDRERGSYNLDAISGTELEKYAGNLTGTGTIPENGAVREELNFALQCNKFFSYFYEGFPDVAWLYYTSASNFINMYPWIASEKFSFSEKLKSVDFYTIADPQNNPDREIGWTSAYLDEAGKGYMVTLSTPIYDHDIFKGVASLDLTNAWLSENIASDYESYLIDDTDTVLAASRRTIPEDATAKISSLHKLSQKEIQKLKGLEKNKVQQLASFFVYSGDIDNAPWKLFLLVPIWVIVGKSVLLTIPVLLLGIFFFLSVSANGKRKRTEKELANSLTELKSYQELLEMAAKYDYLTNTLNRRGLKERFSQLVKGGAGAEAAGAPVSFLIGDIDNFKNFNDTYGHATGDKVLIEIAECIKKNIGSHDVVCRWGGEEFVIMQPDIFYEGALVFAEHIRREIENLIIPWENSQVLKITMTFGVQEGSFEKGIEKSVSEADQALYAGKVNGRNQVVGYRECKEN
ncbi:MAG: hypothetical protein A2Y21_05050 [Clostridiales bacterium GWC2_40_7]|nr:MAG: hypothetical protein A2Y21_05050 [Clostridiales bacterium GWC2_40_7]